MAEGVFSTREIADAAADLGLGREQPAAIGPRGNKPASLNTRFCNAMRRLQHGRQPRLPRGTATLIAKYQPNLSQQSFRDSRI